MNEVLQRRQERGRVDLFLVQIVSNVPRFHHRTVDELGNFLQIVDLHYAVVSQSQGGSASQKSDRGQLLTEAIV